MTTLTEHLETLRDADAERLAAMLMTVAEAGKTIAAELARAALVGRLGTTGTKNVQGETVKKLDAWSNNVVVEALRAGGQSATLVSEELEETLHVGPGRGGWVVCVDPVDGSSNLDINGIVGTIFALRRGGANSAAEVLQPGTAQAAAGYIMYGPSTLLILTTGNGVNGFTLDPASGVYVLSHRNIRMPFRGHTYSANEGNTSKWEASVGRWLEHLKGTDAATDRPYSARYAGSLVADMHRTLLEGGVYCYPAERATASGKLRLLYEAAPMGLIAEQAGGRASTGRGRILDVVPETHHQRVPLFIGSSHDVALAEEFIAGRR
jgi:fructose-1,6-bisphosphatase I